MRVEQNTHIQRTLHILNNHFPVLPMTAARSSGQRNTLCTSGCVVTSFQHITARLTNVTLGTALGEKSAVTIALLSLGNSTSRGPIYKTSYELSCDYLKFIARSAHDSGLERAKISLRNILS